MKFARDERTKRRNKEVCRYRCRCLSTESLHGLLQNRRVCLYRSMFLSVSWYVCTRFTSSLLLPDVRANGYNRRKRSDQRN